MPHLYDCDNCGQPMPCCATLTHDLTGAGEGSFCHHCRYVPDAECEACSSEDREGED